MTYAFYNKWEQAFALIIFGMIPGTWIYMSFIMLSYQKKNGQGNWSFCLFFLVISMLLFQPGNLQILIFWQLYWFLWGQIFKLVSNVHNDMNYIINNWKIKIVLSFENEGKLKRNLKFNIKKIGTGIFFIFYQTTEFFLKKMCAFSTTVETPT